MRVPLSWLKEYVEVTETPQQIADRLTFSGIEVEGIATIGASCDGLVVGEVRAVEKHPNADKLSVCRVFDGTQELQVVCGAPNVKAGGKYPFAPIGVTMPDGKLKIKQAKLRGVDSFGMLCSAAELLLPADASGLLTLDPGCAAGRPLGEILGPPETVLELEITPNRPDCLGIIGVARELAALYGQKLNVPDVSNLKTQVSNLEAVSVQDTDGCSRYTARLLKGIKIGPAPDWMQKRLENAGIRAINNVVDITNYVMLECGQPLHAFDRDLLAEGRIVVRRARAGEKMATLDGIQRDLSQDMLVIADANRPVAVAGVMGGAGSEIRNETSSVLLESACFNSSLVRATSRRLGLSTESSYRFERGVDIEGVDWASRRAAELMVAHAGAMLEPGVTDVYPNPPPARKIACRFDRVRELIGVNATAAEMVSVFRSLGLGIDGETAESCSVRIPSFRSDLQREIDLVEEFSRIYGLDKIPAAMPRAQIDPGADDSPSRALAALRSGLAGLGLREICNYSLVSEPLLDLFNPDDKPERIVLPRPISADQSVLRTSLIPQMVETLGRNRAHQIHSAALFEIGRVFSQGAEETLVSIGLMGSAGRFGLDDRKPANPEDIFLWLKGVLESLSKHCRVNIALRDETAHTFDRASTILVDGAAAGRIGLVKASIRKEWRLTDPVAVLEISVAPFLKSFGLITRVTAIPGYPSIERDVALIADESLSNEKVTGVMRAAAPRELESVRLFDVFRGEAIGKGRKSLAYALTYRSSDRTLTDEEANAYHDTVKSALRKQLGVDIRET